MVNIQFMYLNGIKFIFMRVMLLFLILTFPSLLLAAPSKILRCVTTHYPPFTIYDEKTNTFTGLDIDYIKFIEKNLNLKINVIHLPWARIKKEVELGYYDCYFSLANYKERTQYLDFTSEPLHSTKFGLFALNEDKLLTDDLSKASIAMLRGVILPDIIATKYMIDENNLLRSISTKATFDLLEKKRVQYAITNYQAGLWYSKKYKNTYVKQLNEYSFPVYIAFKQGVIDIKQVDEQIKRFKALK